MLDVTMTGRVVSGAGGALPRPVSSGELLRSAKPKSRGGPEWPRGMRLSVVYGGARLPQPAVSGHFERNLAEAVDGETDLIAACGELGGDAAARHHDHVAAEHA